MSALLSLQPVAKAQYVFDPANADEQGDDIRYFGSVKDGGGAPVSDATLILTYKSSSFVFVTDKLGRFRGHLPADAVAGKVAVKCFKAEFAAGRVAKRAGPAGAKRSVQVDCVLRTATDAVPTN